MYSQPQYRNLFERIAKVASQKLKELLPSFFGICIFLIIWHLLSLRPNTSLPSPFAVVTETWDLIRDPFFQKGGNNKGFFWLILASLNRVIVGYSLAIVIGIPIGFFISLNSFCRKAIDPLIQLLRPVAPLAWLPLAQAVFLKPNPSAIFVICITAIWPIILNTALGVSLVPKDYINVSKIAGLSALEHFYKILLPATLPYIFTGLRIALGLSWLAVVAAEMLLSDDGIGFFIVDAYNNANIHEIILAIFYLGGCGLILDKIMGYISEKVTPQE
ncbi:nitrate ABC transporter permease [Calothrix sp. FACHB-1219]|uniref:nitrate ABC transporter permease n=1 Tax=unclassified Calothrix TaxID=2619626 RepID=UPI0016873637|nr:MULTISPECIES: nitrate ABC transporter permease [unclassified Calothrix]MBD2207967.1 nitrate ABC transporter permease [Calothrix sp. FACHB-168]MBD2222519.1 nitrate ABC transporter permease [Calothrix sp. FACHB-1219]